MAYSGHTRGAGKIDKRPLCEANQKDKQKGPEQESVREGEECGSSCECGFL